MHSLLFIVSLLIVSITGNGHYQPFYPRGAEDEDFLFTKTLLRRALIEEFGDLILGRRADYEELDDVFDIYTRDEYEEPLLARAFEVEHVSEKCADCLTAGMLWTRTTIPAQLTKEEYARLDMVGVSCRLKGDCTDTKIRVGGIEMTEAAIWAKAQGHTQAQDSGTSSSGTGSGGSRNSPGAGVGSQRGARRH